MTRVSLKEAYDNKDVIAQIYAIRDTAESAEDSAEQAVTTANTASDHVDALVPQVKGAVQNANSASASAQASAQTVAGYENRLATAEGDIDNIEDDLNAVTLRVTTAEGDIVTIQGRVTALETADGQNVKLTGEHAIGNYALLLTGNQTALGSKQIPEISRMKSTHVGSTDDYQSLYEISISNNLASGVFEIYDRGNHKFGAYYVDVRNYDASITKLYGNTTADRFAIAINTDRTKMFVFMRSTRVNADVKWCAYGWQDEFVGSLISVNRDITETVETLVPGETYQWVAKA